ncbi:MAG: MoaD/ThiS family protein [Planctomycetaceae bacterium]
MNVRVQLFAAARDRAGTDTAELTLSDSATASDLREALVVAYPDLEPIASHLLLAIDDNYATDETLITPSSRLACFPPVSGG